MDIADWRVKIDEIDRKLVELLNERARAAQAIGKIKAQTHAPIYEPEREKVIVRNVCRNNTGPLPEKELVHLFEIIVDVKARAIQVVDRDAAAPGSMPGQAGTEGEKS